MSFKDKMTKSLQDNFMRKNGDRITQVQGNVISVKVEEKTILWIFHKLTATLLIKPDRSKTIVKCVYTRNKWFKKPEFMTINQGNLVIVQGLKAIKSKKGKDKMDIKEAIEIMNIMNLTTKKDLVNIEGKEKQVKQIKQVRRMK